MKEIVLIIHTHIDYSYLWPIINDYIKKCNMKKILVHNSLNIDILPINFDKYLYYNDTINYAQRITNILNQIDEKYVFIVHDVDIIINFNMDAINSYYNIQVENNIDRIHCATFNGNGQIYKNDYALCNLNLPLKSSSNHFIPIDCCPAIWKRNSLINLLNLFPNETYASLELNTDVIKYCKQHLKCYGIQYTSNLSIKYCRGLTYNNQLAFLHFTTKSKFTFPIEVYMDFQDILKTIIEKYNININNIGIENSTHVLSSFRPLMI